MILLDDAFDVAPVEVGVYFGGGDAFVAEHFLYCAQVGTSFHQVGGEGVPEGMWTDGLGNSRNFDSLLDHHENHFTCESCAPAIKENKVFFPFFDFNMLTNTFHV